MSFEMKRLTDEIKANTVLIRQLMAQQSSGQISYDQTVIPSDFSHKHMPSALQSGNLAAAINFTTRPTYNGADVIVDGDPVGLQADDDATRLGVDADTAVTTGTKVLHTQLVGPLGVTPFITPATSDSDPNLDADPLLGTHALLSFRKDAATTIGATGTDGTYNPLHVRHTDGSFFMPTMDVITRGGYIYLTDGNNVASVLTSCFTAVTTQDPLLVKAVVHGEDLDVGAGNSEPIKVRTEDGNIPTGEKHLETISLAYRRRTAQWEEQRPGEFGVTMEIESIAASQDFIMIDKSDTTNFPHTTGTGTVHITVLDMEIDPDSSFVGDIELGFLENVDATNGDFHVMKEWHMDKRADIIEDFLNLVLDPFRCYSTFHLTNEISLDDTAFQTDVALSSPFKDTVAYTTVSGDGDIALRVTMSAGTADLSLVIKYYVE